MCSPPKHDRCLALGNHPMSEIELRGLNIFNCFREQCAKSVNMDSMDSTVIAMFPYQIMREMSAASIALSTKANLYVRRALMFGFILSDKIS